MSFGIARDRDLDHRGVGLTADDLPSFGEQTLVDPRDWFGETNRNRPFHVEIGSGKGTFLVQQAAIEPEVNYLGIEWAGEFFRYAADRIQRHGLENVRMLHADGIEFIRYRMPDSIVNVVHLYFPDPWPKKRHHKRRSIQDRSLIDLHRVLCESGEVRIVTDHDGYWTWIVEHIERHGGLFRREAFERPESAGETEIVGTNFERKYRREGRPFHAVTLRKRPDPDAATHAGNA